MLAVYGLMDEQVALVRHASVRNVAHFEVVLVLRNVLGPHDARYLRRRPDEKERQQREDIALHLVEHVAVSQIVPPEGIAFPWCLREVRIRPATDATLDKSINLHGWAAMIFTFASRLDVTAKAR